MQRISELTGQRLEWTQPATFRKHYELRAGDQLVATLHFPHFWSCAATGESAEGRWDFRRGGFWRTRIGVSVGGTTTAVGSLACGVLSGEGKLVLEDGREFRARTGFWGTSLVLRDAQEAELIRFATRGVLHLTTLVEVRAGAERMPELPWLAMLGCYAAVQRSEDAGGAAAAAGAS